MDLNREPSAIMNAAANEVRAFNHRSLDPKTFTHPAEVSDTANALATLLQYLPQALTQMEAGLTALYERDAIRLDDIPPNAVSRKDIADRVATALGALRDTRESLGRAHEDVLRATGPLSHMGSPWGDAEDED